MKRIATLATVFALAAPASALAGPSSQSCAYGQLCDVVHQDGPGPSANSSSNVTSSGTLPFTGLDVALLAAGGGGLLGIGLVVRRVSARAPRQ